MTHLMILLIDQLILRNPLVGQWLRVSPFILDIFTDLPRDVAIVQRVDLQTPLIVAHQGVLSQVGTADDDRLVAVMLKNIAFLMKPIHLSNFNRQAWNLEQLIKGLGLIKVQIVRSQ